MLPFDTFAYAKELHRAGVSPTQVDAQVTALGHAFKNCFEKYPTKHELNKVETKLTASILETELRLKGSIDSITVELKLLKWLSGVCITGIATMLFRSL